MFEKYLESFVSDSNVSMEESIFRKNQSLGIPEGEVLVRFDFFVNSEGEFDFSIIEDVYIYMSLCRFCGLKPQIVIGFLGIAVTVIGPKESCDELEKRWGDKDFVDVIKNRALVMSDRDDIYVAASIFEKLGYEIVEDYCPPSPPVSDEKNVISHTITFRKFFRGGIMFVKDDS